MAPSNKLSLSVGAPALVLVRATPLGLQSSIYIWAGSLTLSLLGGLALGEVNHGIRLHALAAVSAALLSAILIYLRAKVDAALLPYLLFFLISITSLLEITQPLTGIVSDSKSFLLSGLAFYTLAIAYRGRSELSWSFAFIAANPLLLASGPVATLVRNIRYRSLRRRAAFFCPFVVLGVFLHQVIATPLTAVLKMLQATDVVSVLVSAAIFEIFVYANFCGISLLVYGVLGCLGLRVPLNFRQPFSSRNLVDFWRGWHVTLSQVLKQLFYLPVRRICSAGTAIVVVFLCSGLWHGITLNFLIWGAFHAGCFVATRMLLPRVSKVWPTWLMVFALIVGRAIFAESDSDRLLQKFRLNFQGFGPALSLLSDFSSSAKVALALGCLFICLEFFLSKTQYFRQRTYKFYRLPWLQVVLLTFIVALISSSVGIDYAVYGQR